MRKHLIIILIVCLKYSIFAQQTEFEVRKLVKSASEFDLIKENSRMLQDDYYFFAEIIADKLLEINPSSPNYNYRKGFIILNSRQDWYSALPYLQLAVTDLDKNFDAYSSNEKSAPTDALYHLARCYHYDKQIEKAKIFYARFIKESNPKSVLMDEAKLRLLQCDVAQKMMESPKRVTIKNVGNKINSPYPEYSPVVSFDGSALYFTSRRQWADGESDLYKDPMYNQYPEDIYVSYKDITYQTWSDPERLSFCEAEFNEASVTVSADERRIYTYEDRTGNGDLYYADFRMNKFRNLTIMPYASLNTKYWETHCTVTPDGQQIYFVSDRPGGFGGRDIYRMVKLPDGTWSAPMNLGPRINTAYDEDSPFIAIDNKRLYFSSNGPSSMGEFDIFVTFRDEDGNWSSPINLGYPINTPGDDVFYTMTADGTKGYLTSFRGDGQGEKDIYEIQYEDSRVGDLAVLKAGLKTTDGSLIPERVVAILKCINCDVNAEKLITPRVRDGMFSNTLIPCREYEISFKLDSTDQVVLTRTFRTDCKPGYQETRINAILDVEKNTIVPDVVFSLKGSITDKKSNKKLPNATIIFRDLESGIVKDSLQTDKNGFFISEILKNAYPGKHIRYEVTIYKEKYITQSFDWSLTLDTVSEQQLAFGIEKREVGIDLVKTANLNPVFYENDQWEIGTKGEIELNKIVKLLNQNPAISIELGSHTDCRNTESYNMELSEKRSKACSDYLKARVKNPNRISYKAYGETRPLINCKCGEDDTSECSEEQHQANRRTEFRIVKN